MDDESKTDQNQLLDISGGSCYVYNLQVKYQTPKTAAAKIGVKIDGPNAGDLCVFHHLSLFDASLTPSSHIPRPYGDFPIWHRDFPKSYGDFPMSFGDFPMSYGDFPK
jgi:hypothetical protein